MHHSKRLLLDIPCRDDFQRFYEIHSDPQTNLFNPAGPLDLAGSEQAFEKLITHWGRYNFGSWTIKLNGPGTIIGFGGLSYRMYLHEEKLNLGYRFDRNYWGKGYASELASYAISFGFSELQFDKIFAIVRPKHAASIKILEKSGMKLIETINDVPGKENSLVYIIENNEFTGRRSDPGFPADPTRSA